MMLSDINSSNPHFSIILGDFNVRSNNWWQGDTQTSEGSQIDYLTTINIRTNTHFKKFIFLY